MFKLSHNQENNYFTLTSRSDALMRSIAHVLNVNNNLVVDNNRLDFEANSVISLEDYMAKDDTNTYENTLSIVSSLTTQLEYLINVEQVTFYEYRTKNVLVVIFNEKVNFIYVSNNLLEIKKEKHIKFTKPFNREECFISPEIQNMKHIPTEINYKTIYYSLGSLATFFLFKKLFSKKEEAEEVLRPIAYTKLYWLLLRTLEIIPERRSIIYV